MLERRVEVDVVADPRPAAAARARRADRLGRVREPLLQHAAQRRPGVRAEREQRVQHRAGERALRQPGLALERRERHAVRRAGPRAVPAARACDRAVGQVVEPEAVHAPDPTRSGYAPGHGRDPTGRAALDRVPRHDRPGRALLLARAVGHADRSDGAAAGAAEAVPPVERIVLTNRHHYRHSDRFREERSAAPCCAMRPGCTSSRSATSRASRGATSRAGRDRARGRRAVPGGDGRGIIGGTRSRSPTR